MPELRSLNVIRVAPREAEATVDGAPAPRAESSLRAALRDVATLLPSRDPSRNGRFKLAVLLGWGAPLWYALAGSLLVSETTLRTPLLPVLAIFFVASLVGPIATTLLTALPLTFAFYALQGADTRARLRQALVCPYCRDEVGRDGTVLCARSGCGALYHDECWRECAEQYGGCAVYGCSSRKCREVSATGFVLRLARLGLAAVLFPPRVARAITSSERESFLAIWRRADRFTNLIAVSPDPAENTPRKLALYACVSAPLSIAFAIAFFSFVTNEVPSQWALQHFFTKTWAPLAFAGLVFGVAFVLPRIVSLPPALVYYAYRAVAEVLKGELAALARGDQGGGTVLGRLAAGFGAKKA